MYEYKAVVTDVYDGDTITVDIDLGFHIVLHGVKLRLIGINTPEVRGPTKEKGKCVRDWVRDRILGKEVTVKTEKKGKYGRWLANVYYIWDVNQKPVQFHLNDDLLALGMAVPYIL
jgi:micrococcal nuclease